LASATAIRRCLALTAVATALFASAAQAAGPDPVGPPSQALADGCQRSIMGLLTFTSPEWVYVYSYDPQRFEAPDQTRVVEGTAQNTHPAGDDLPEGHQYFDLNSNIVVDAQYQDLLGGDPARETGNYAPGEEQGRLHVEWESGLVPTYAWPTENDRVKLWGSWIWDCGHWGVGFPDYFLPSQVEGQNPRNGPITGERTELHSMKFMVVTRDHPYRPVNAESETDVYGSTEGAKSHAQEKCAHENPPEPDSTSYSPEYSACIQLPESQVQAVNDRDYSFFVPAPPKPSSDATLTYRIEDMIGQEGQPVEEITPRPDATPPGIDVTVKYQGSAAPAYGKSFFVRWLSPDPDEPEPILLTVDSIKVNHSLDPNPDAREQTGEPPGEYNLYMDANGYWKFLNDWAPGLGAVSDGDTFTVGQSVSLNVPSGAPLRILFRGRECDFPAIEPCPDTAELAPSNDIPGVALAQFPTVEAALGTHTAYSDAHPSADPDSPDYEVTYTVRRAGYPRPLGATPARAALVVAYDECTSPNRTHGSPLAVGSCSPPVQTSGQLTVGTLDANGKPANSVGVVRYDVVNGDPGTPVNESDVRLQLSLTDVRNRGSLSDYTGELLARNTIRITDRASGPSGGEAATTADTPLSFAVPCAATAGTGIGSVCATATTVNSLMPGAVQESQSAIWQLGEVQVFDGGPDGDAATDPNTLFADQGFFVP
jgi:hypothetical protein